MKEMLEVKDRALIKHQLEAALHSKATSMVNANAATKLIKSGSIEKFVKAGKSKKGLKWVEIYCHDGTATETGLTKGYLTLTFADAKDSQLANRCQVIRINEKSNRKPTTFSLDVTLSGKENELVFACEDEKETESWVEAIDNGFKQIADEMHALKMVNDYMILEIEFSKDKLGIRVEEKVLEAEDDAKEAKVGDDEQAESKHTEAVAVEEVEDRPCDLIVKAITDNDLHATGLTVGFIVSAINRKSLRGMKYSQQVKQICSTKKPFSLTFIKKDSENPAAYPRILEQLLADGDNAVKSAFYELVEGTTFGKELEDSEDKAATIGELMANHRRLAALLQNTRIQEAEL